MQIAHLLKQSVSIKNPTGARDKHGNEAIGAAATYAARFQKTTKVIVTAEKEREPIDGIVFLDRGAVVQRGAQLTYGANLYRVMRVDDVVGRNGNTHHYELMVQEWSYA